MVFKLSNLWLNVIESPLRRNYRRNGREISIRRAADEMDKPPAADWFLSISMSPGLLCSALGDRVIVDGLRETIEERQMRLPVGNNCSEWIAINCTHECSCFWLFCCSLIPTDWYCNFIAPIYCEPRITTGCSAYANYSATGNCLIAHMICIIPTIVWI